MTTSLPLPKKKNPLKRTRVPVSPPGIRSRAGTALAVAATEGRFALQHCSECGVVQYPPRDLCRACLSDALEWRDTDPSGQIIAETTIRATPDTYFRDHLPVRIGTVQLIAGAVVICRLHADVKRGDKVRIVNRIDRAGQAIMLAVPEHEVPHMRDDPTMRELSCDPRHRRVLITDARAPEAAALVTALLEAGVSRVFVGLSEDWKPFPERAEFKHHTNCSIVPLDVTNAESLRDLAAEIGGKVDILINNSRFIRPGGLFSRSDTVFARQELETGALGLTRLIQSFGPAMASRGDDGVNSATAWVNMLPIGALVPGAGSPMTSASGAASLALSHALRAEMRGSGVRVMNLYTGPMDDDWHQELPPPKLAPKALASTLVRALIDGLEEVTAGDVARDLYARWRKDPALAIREAMGGTSA